MEKCTSCGGTCKAQIEISEYGSDKPVETVEIECPTCDGTGEVPDGTKAALDDFWCKCKGNVDVRFYDNGEHPKCNKHCYACTTCGRIVQVG